MLLASRRARALPIALVAATLWILRPGFPQLPESLTGPTTVEQLEEMLVFLGWLALIVLLALAVIRPVRTTRQHGGVTPVAEPRRSHAANHERGSGQPARPSAPPRRSRSSPRQTSTKQRTRTPR
jgi:hypothetical protein